MKRMSGLKRLFRGYAAVLVSGVLLASGVSAADAEAVIQGPGGLAYVAGGVGDESRARIQAMSGDFNLKLVFAMDSGAFLSDVRVSIADAAGHSLLDTRSGGPWFLASLPAGHYLIAATYSGEAMKREITLDAGTPRTIDFRWRSK